MTIAGTLELIKEWQERLNLQPWTIGISMQLPRDTHDMEIVMTPIRQHASLRISQKCYSLSKGKFEKLIIHELLHILFEPVQREYDHRELELAGYNLSNPSRHTHAIEVAIDNLSKTLYNLKT